MFDGHYDYWLVTRMNGLKKHIYPRYFKSKTLLEMGCGHAHVGQKFHEMGADVTCTDVRTEHIRVVNDTKPHIKTLVFDADKDDIPGAYDIILHWGTLYHLAEIENHLEKISHKCNVLLLDTEVCDSDDNTFFITTDEDGYDQAFNKKGIRPSPAYVEKILTKNGFRFELINDPVLNCGFHIYDWNIKNTRRWSGGLRRFWICWKNVESPITESMRSVICKTENPLRVAIVFVGRATCYEDSLLWFEDIARMYDVHFYCSLNSNIEPYEDFIKMFNIKKYNFEIYQPPDEIKIKSGPNQLSMFYNLKKGVDLISANDYDIILYARTDFVYEQNIEFSLGSDNDIYIPSGHDYTGINDQMCYGSPIAMKKYASLYEDIDTYVSLLKNDVTGDVRPEDLLKHHIDTTGLSVHRFDLEYEYNSNRHS